MTPVWASTTSFIIPKNNTQATFYVLLYRSKLYAIYVYYLVPCTFLCISLENGWSLLNIYKRTVCGINCIDKIPENYIFSIYGIVWSISMVTFSEVFLYSLRRSFDVNTNHEKGIVVRQYIICTCMKYYLSEEENVQQKR